MPLTPNNLTPTMTAPTPLNRRTFAEPQPLNRSTIPEPNRNATPTFAGALDAYQRTAGQVMRNTQSGRTSNITNAIMGAYVNSQPGGSKYDPNMLRHPGDTRQDWQMPDQPTYGIYSGVYGQNNNPFAPTNITPDGRPSIYGAKSPFEIVTGKNLAQIGSDAQSAADEKARQSGASGPGKVDFGSVGRDPIGDLYRQGNLNLNVDQGKGGTQPSIYADFSGNESTAPSYSETLSARAQPYSRGHDMANARWDAQHNVWADNPYLLQDTQAYMMARTPQNIGATTQFQNMYDQAGMSPYGRSQQVVNGAAAAAKAGTYGDPNAPAAERKSMFDAANESAGLQAKGLYAMGMPGSSPYAGWYDQWDTTPPAISNNGYGAAQQIGRQIGKTGNIFQRDYGKQTAAAPSMASTTGAQPSLYASLEPTRGGKLKRAPQAPTVPQAAPVQQRYALQGGGGAGGGDGFGSGSALLDELRKGRKAFA